MHSVKLHPEVYTDPYKKMISPPGLWFKDENNMNCCNQMRHKLINLYLIIMFSHFGLFCLNSQAA